MTEHRRLNRQELRIVKVLLEGASSQWRGLIDQLDTVRVREMSDGGMGSLRFEYSAASDRKLGPRIASAEFKDEDGVSVSVELNADQDHRLFELDVWKVNFAPLIAWPDSDALTPKAD